VPTVTGSTTGRPIELRPGGDGQGIVVFAGGLRSFSVRVGFRSVRAGLVRAGWTGRVLYWNWHRPFLRIFTLGVYMDCPRLEVESTALAAFLAELKANVPDRPVHLIGCSAGGYIVLRATELLPADTRLDSLALLSAAVDPRRDLAAAARHLDGPLVNASSWMDWLILGAGTYVLGTADRVHTPAAGMVGFKSDCPSLVEVPWRARMIALGRLGEHTTSAVRPFITRCIAPAMGIGAA